MKYGLIGKKIGYSYSKDIHDLSLNDDYEILSLNDKKALKLIESKNYKGLNITIPYKKTFLDKCVFKDKIVKKIGVCNTIVNKNKKLYAYNTDYFGFYSLLKFYKINVNNKNIMILGSGATCNTIKLVLNDLKVASIVVISRKNYPTYHDISLFSKNIDIIINATPYGTYPNTKSKSLVNPNNFKKEVIAIDVIFNPYRSVLLQAFNSHYNGLYMLVSQAIKADFYFESQKCNQKKINDIYYQILLDKVNLVLIGMPGSGKTTFGKYLSLKLNKEFIDSDNLIEIKENRTCAEIINNDGINEFRKKEKEIIKSLKNQKGKIIATGGGVILDNKNIKNLKENGLIIYLKRPLNKLVISNTRPLSDNINKIKKLYKERKDIYENISDITLYNNSTIDKIYNDFILKFKKYR